MSLKPVPALSIRQPWADLIVAGIKDVENRTWPTSFRGFLLIHAPRTVDTAALPGTVELLGLRSAGDYHPVTGAIVGYAEIVNCVTRHSSRFFGGPYGFVLANARRFPEPIPCVGRLGIFDVPGEILRERNYELPSPERARHRS
ncbi:MAG TPA: ASCH domain-containing protein [Thermoanaerobaculia bacterium]|nr:ASCH domain-containing protein [Thermoanaerobaculia bacterium]